VPLRRCAFASLTHSNTCIIFTLLPILTLLSSVVSPELYLGSSFFLHGASFSLIVYIYHLCIAWPHTAHVGLAKWSRRNCAGPGGCRG